MPDYPSTLFETAAHLIAQHVDRGGLSRVYRVEGFDAESARSIAQALRRAPSITAAVIGPKTLPDGVTVSVYRATKLRNTVDSNPDSAVVLFSPLGSSSSGSVDDIAVCKVTRGAIFSEALRMLISEKSIDSHFVRQVRSYAPRNSDEDIFLFLTFYSSDSPLPVDLLSCTLGLLPDTLLAEDISDVPTRLAQNRAATNILLRRQLVSDGRLLKQLADEKFNAVQFRQTCLEPLKRWRRETDCTITLLHNYLSFDQMERGEAALDFDFTPQLSACPPHDGFTAKDVLLGDRVQEDLEQEVEAEVETPSKVTWQLSSLCSPANVRFVVWLVEAETGEDLVRVKSDKAKPRGNSCKFNWVRLLRTKQVLNEALRSDGEDGHALRIRVVAERGQETTIVKESAPFHLVGKEDVVLDERTQDKGLPPTAAHALYRAAATKGQHPQFGRTSMVPSEHKAEMVIQFDRSKVKTALDVPWKLWAAVQPRILASIPAPSGFAARVDIAQESMSEVTLRDTPPLPRGGLVDQFLEARSAYLHATLDPANVPLSAPEVLLYSKSEIMDLAIAYAESFRALSGLVGHHTASVLPAGEQHRIAGILQIDTIQLRDSSQGLEMLVLLPTHPTVVAWQAALHQLVVTWAKKSPKEMPAYEDIVGALRCGPRCMAFPLFNTKSNTVRHMVYGGNLASLWSFYCPPERAWDEDDLEAIQEIAGVSKSPVWESPESHRYLGRRIEQFAELHPYKDALSLYALNPGSGIDLLEALRLAGREKHRLERRRVNVSLANAGPLASLGDAIDKMVTYPGANTWRKYSEAILGKQESILSPGFAYAKRTTVPSGGSAAAARCLVETCTEANGYDIAILRKMLEPTTGSYEPAASASGSFHLYGLELVPVVKFSRDLGAASRFAGDWIVGFDRAQDPSNAAYAHHYPNSTRPIFLALIGATQTLWDLAGAALEMPSGSAPALRISLLEDHRKALETAHTKCRWVIIQDPLFSVELLDRRDRTQDQAGPVLLDFAPEFAPFPASQLVVATTKATELQRAAQRVATEFIGADIPVMERLAAISARLLMKMSNPTRQVLGERAGLILAHYYLLRKNRNVGFVIPMDAHKEMFLQTSDSTSDRRMADYIFVRCKRGGLAMDVIEVKYTAESAFPMGQFEKGLKQAKSSAELLAELFKDRGRVDKDYRYEKLGEILEFYRARAERHGFATNISAADLEMAIQKTCRRCGSLKINQSVLCVAPRIGPEDDQWPARIREHELASIICRDDIHSLLSDEGISVQDLPERAPTEDPATDIGPDEPGESGPSGQQPPSPPTPTPTAHQPTGSSGVSTPEDNTIITLGTSSTAKRPVTWEPATLANGHFLLIGGSGAGKTTTLRHLLWQIRKSGIPVLTVDFHGDILPYQSEEDHLAFHDGTNEFHFNPFIVDDDCTAQRCRQEFVEVLRVQNTAMGTQQAEVLTRAIDYAYKTAGQVDFSVVYEAVQHVDLPKGLESVRATLPSYLRSYLESGLFHVGSPVSIDRLLAGLCRLDLSDASEESRNAFADIVFRKLFLRMKKLGAIGDVTIPRDKFRCFVLLDEAQIFLQSDKSAKACLARYASEARKFGIGLILATQLFDNVPKDIRGNIDSRLFMLCLDEEEKRKNAKAVGVSPEDIGNLSKGQGYFHSSKLKNPVRIQVAPPWI